MVKNGLFIFAFFYGSYSLACEKYLVPPTQTSIGVLAEDRDGRPILGLSPFIGLMHEDLLRILIRRHNIKAVVWLGEATHFSYHQQPRITVANETSGFYAHDHRHDGLTYTIANDVEKIPGYWRDSQFKGHHYNVLEYPHLDGPLIFYSANLRHEVRATLQFVSSMIGVIKNPNRTPQTDLVLISQVNSSRLKVLILVWLKEHLITNGRLRPEESVQIEKLTDTLQKTIEDVGDLQQLDFDKLGFELQKLTQLTDGNPEDTKFFVGHSREEP